MLAEAVRDAVAEVVALQLPDVVGVADADGVGVQVSDTLGLVVTLPLAVLVPHADGDGDTLIVGLKLGDVEAVMDVEVLQVAEGVLDVDSDGVPLADTEGDQV
eukprot:TRINITY_DN6096_c0_g1_i2.p3 TRINITY_DN6096_c0_g1~~TRINITY_DN6096_c0_g1_i2.p3  ORF type:complete len:103 (+),score=37.04 TRINITY_DN6096_c0_g1_i2:829-1137(+)